MSGDEPAASDPADRIVLSYRSPSADRDRERWPFADGDWVPGELCRDSYRGYLRRVHGGDVERGDEWEEFVDRGCGRSADVVLRVEALEGGTTLGEGTEIDVVHRREILAE